MSFTLFSFFLSPYFILFLVFFNCSSSFSKFIGAIAESSFEMLNDVVEAMEADVVSNDVAMEVGLGDASSVMIKGHGLHTMRGDDDKGVIGLNSDEGRCKRKNNKEISITNIHIPKWLHAIHLLTYFYQKSQAS